MNRLICKLFGHNWHEHPSTRRLKLSRPFCECSRCGKTGWLL